LSCDFSVASSAIATELGKDRDDLIWEVYCIVLAIEFDCDLCGSGCIAIGSGGEGESSAGERRDEAVCIDGDDTWVGWFEANVSGEVEDGGGGLLVW
jgi:hypothetical protein